MHNSSGNIIFFFRTLFSLLVFSVLFYSCEEPDFSIGSDVLPSSDKIILGSYDSVEVNSYTGFDSSFQKYFNAAYGLIGCDEDPDFGIKSSNALTTFGPSYYNILWGDSNIVDSMVLVLNNTSVYGDPSFNQNISVYSVSDSISADSIWYANYTKSMSLYSQIGYSNINFSTKKIRIPLYKKFANGFVDIDSAVRDSLFSFYYSNKFIEKFPGILIKTEKRNGRGGLMNVNYDSSTIELHYRYKNNNDTVYTSNIIYFTFSYPFNKHINVPEFDYSGVRLGNIIDGNVTEDSVVYVQALSGLRSYIEIPDLKLWKDSGVVINSAELVINIEDWDKISETLTPPNYIGIRALDSGRVKQSSYTLNTNMMVAKNNNNSYTFNITHYINLLLKETFSGTSFYVYASNSDGSQYTILPSRVIFAGTNNSRKMKLKIIYSKTNY